MTRRLTLVLALALLAAPALAARELPDELMSLEDNLQARVDEIGVTPATKQEGKEAKKLMKALGVLDTYTATNDIPDLKILGKAGKLILKSKTADEPVWQDVRDVVYCLIDLAKEKKGLGEDVLTKLYDDKYKALVQKILDKGQTHLDTASAMVMDDPVKAEKILMKAWKLFLKSVLKGEKFEQKEEDALPDHLTIHRGFLSPEFSLYNSANKDHFIRDVILTGEWHDDGELIRTDDNASVAAVWPAQFVIQVFGSGNTLGWDCPCMVSRTYPGDPTQYEDLNQYFNQYKELLMPGRGTMTFTGTMVLVITNRYTGGTTYRIPYQLNPLYVY